MRALIALLLLAGQSWAVCASGSLAYYNGTIVDPCNGYDLSQTGTVTTGTDSGYAYFTGFTTSNYFSLPAGLRTALQSLSSWTFEWDMKCTGDGTNDFVWSLNGGGLEILRLGTAMRNNLAGAAIDAGSMTAANGWVFWSMSASSGTRKTYRNGSLVGSTGTNTVLYASITSGNIGVKSGAEGACTCYLANLRASNVDRLGVRTVDPTTSATNQLSPYVMQGMSPFVSPRWLLP